MSDVFYVIGEDTATDIADSIRTKKGYSSDHKLKAEDFADEITNIGTPLETLISNSTADGSVDLVSDIEGTIAVNAFYNNKKIKSISFPNLEHLNSNCFDSCTNLTTVDLPEIVDTGVQSFQNCTGLTSVTLPNATTIGQESFKGCANLTTVDLPEATTLNANAFQNTQITSLNLPKIKTINGGALQGYRNSVFENNSVEIFNGGTVFGGDAYGGYVQKIKSTSLTEIKDSGCERLASLQELDCPNLTKIGRAGFRNNTNSNNKLVKVNAPNIQWLGAYAFNNNPLLESVNSDVIGELNFPELTTVETYWYDGYNNGGQFISLPKIKIVRLPKLANGGHNLFNSSNNIEEIYVNPNLTTMFMFPPNKIKKINSETDGIINLPNITSSLTTFSSMANITEMYLSSYTGTMPAFATNPLLTTLDAGNITAVTNGWLKDCPSLTTVILRNTTTVLAYNSNANTMAGTTVPANVSFYVPANLVSAYESSQWHTTKGITIVPIDDEVIIGSDTYDCLVGEKWEEWILSANNTDGYVTVGNIIMDSTKANYVTQNGVAVLPGQVINGTAYDLTPLNS